MQLAKFVSLAAVRHRDREQETQLVEVWVVEDDPDVGHQAREVSPLVMTERILESDFSDLSW